MEPLDTPQATAPRPSVAALNTPLAVGLLVIGSLLALAALRAGFRGAVVQIGA